MFYLPLSILAWIAAIWLIQWTRIRALLIYGLMGSFLALFQDHVGEMFQLWLYNDTGPVNTHDQISLLISVSAAPLLAMYFAQGLSKAERTPWRRIMLATIVAMVPELAALYLGRISYASGWNLWVSVGAHGGLWYGFWRLYQWMSAASIDRVH